MALNDELKLAKYTVNEIERRWLVDVATIDSLDTLSYSDIADLYIANTRLRLRCVSEDTGKTTYKLCKKYGKTTAIVEPITNIYLSEQEYLLLTKLTGSWSYKRRYRIAGGGLDIYQAHNNLTVFEKEFHSEAEALSYVPPDFVGQEVSNNPKYGGAKLAIGNNDE